jgi:hypothetical protein
MPALQAYRSAPPVRLEEFDGAYRLQTILHHGLKPPGLHKTQAGVSVEGYGITHRYVTYGDRPSLLEIFGPYPRLFGPKCFRRWYPTAIRRNPIWVLQPRFVPNSIVSECPSEHVWDFPRRPRYHILQRRPGSLPSNGGHISLVVIA